MSESAAYAVRGGLDLEDANDANHTVFSGIQSAIEEGRAGAHFLTITVA